MRFMVLVKATAHSEAGEMPSAALIEEMGRFNEELAAAGMRLAADGLHPTSKATRLTWAGGPAMITDGPFTETKELVSGYWMIQAPSLEAVIEQFKRCPPPGGDGAGEIEIRPLFEMSDFPEDILPPDAAERHRTLQERL